MIYYLLHTICGSGTDGGMFIEASSGTCASSSGDGSVRLMDVMVTEFPSFPVSVCLLSF